jgi:hypothetical protein
VVVLVKAQSAFVLACFLEAHPVEIVAALEHLDVLLVELEVLLARIALVLG